MNSLQQLRVATRLGLGFAILIALLVVTTVLVQTNPEAGAASGSTPVSPSTSISTTTTNAVAGFTASLPQGPWTATVTLDQASVGRHRMTIVLEDSALPFGSPLTVKGRLVLAEKNLGPIPVLLEQTGDREWATDAVEIPAAGNWSLEVLVVDDGSTDGTAAAPRKYGSASAPRPSRRSMSPSSQR